MKGLLLEKDGGHYFFSFIKKINNTRLKLKRSIYGSAWTNPGELVLSFHDDGNGITFEWKGGKSFRLDYSEVVELQQVLLILRDYDDLGKDTRRVILASKVGKGQK